MTSKITVSASYNATAIGTADLSPKTWDDVKDWYIKWDILYVKFKDELDWKEFNLQSDHNDGVDWKRPNHADIYAGDWEFENELDTTGF